ncbi:hypothetical protein M514_25171 [Trichuris suis]|uniref:Uncharacterized protein n=1 Tax=Trichuris suis TaxID=68888 RepID=A0A085MZQ0_9BILA|nr:hypothetical protein M514_25171 [Trichuris suis]
MRMGKKSAWSASNSNAGVNSKILLDDIVLNSICDDGYTGSAHRFGRLSSYKAHEEEEDYVENSEIEHRVMVISLIETSANTPVGAIWTTSRIVACCYYQFDAERSCSSVRESA